MRPCLIMKKCISKVSLSLLNEDEVYRVQVALNDKPSPELDEIILKEANSNLFADWILLFVISYILEILKKYMR